MEKESTLQENVSDFIDERLNESYRNLKMNKRYVKLEQEDNRLFTEIEKVIKDKELVERYQKSAIDMYDMQIKEAYRTGFKDANILLLDNVTNKQKGYL